MDKNVHPLAATLFLIIAITGIGAWFWGTGAARTFGGPAGLTVSPSGHLYIQINDQLLEHDETGSFVRRHDLGDLGVELLIGGTAFFSNGDILLRRGPDTRSFLDNLRAYQRQTNRSELTPDAEDTGLFRCNLDTGSCSAFGEPTIDFKAAFSVFIDTESDTVYISDSSRHLVRKYSEDGVELAPAAGGYRFPNQLMIDDGVLLVADTNHHRIRAVDHRDPAFGDELFRKNVVPRAASTNDRRWPSHFVRVGEEWWVNNMQTGMNYGSIYVFDREWGYDRQIDFPELEDPIALIRFNDEILVSDWYGDRVHRLSLDGERLGDFHSEGLIAVLDEFGVERQRYRLYAWVTVGLAVFLCLVVLVRGTDWTGRPGRDDDPDVPTDTEGPIWLTPEPENVNKMRAALRNARYLTVPIVAVIAGLIAFSGFSAAVMQLIVAAFGFTLLYLGMDWMTRVSTNTAIYLDGDRVLLRIHTGQESRVSARDVYFSDTFVATDGVAIFLGQPQTPLYDRKKVMAALRQRLPASQRVSQWAIQKKLIAMRHPYGLVLIIAVTLLVVLGILQLGGIISPGESP